jgi:hypothetical protein
MHITPYHAKFFAHELTRRCPPDSVERLVGALVDAQVDLNPHQVDAALCAFYSPVPAKPRSRLQENHIVAARAKRPKGRR